MPAAAIVYFIAVSGQVVLNGDNQVRNTEFLNALAFIAGLSDRFAITLFKRVTTTYSKDSDSK
jgi:hypothetical protein